MRRWFAVVLFVLLPLQMSWAVAAACCGDVAVASTAHGGHHDHASHADGDADKPCAGECGLCHLGHCGALLPPSQGELMASGRDHHAWPMLPMPRWHAAEPPERPQWPSTRSPV
jgi:hypothetical protein